jgi:hypothetical protein
MRSNPCADKAALHAVHGRFHGFAMNFRAGIMLRCGDVALAGRNVACAASA